MLLSACIIAKNEALTLRKCLESLQGVADEIIVIDTGSTDQTMDIAREFGCIIHEFEWCNDFSAARNESLRYAQGTFILVIDADEYLDSKERLHVREFLTQTDAEGIFVISKSYLGSLTHLSSAVPIRVMRIFRRGHLYSGAIHEQIADSVFHHGGAMATLDLTLHHLGYTDEFLARRSKTSRNTALLEQELKQDPTNVFQQSNLIVEYMMQRDWEKAYQLANRTWQELKRKSPTTWPNFTPRIVLNLITIEWELGKRDQAIHSAREGIHLFPWYTDLLRRYASFLMQHNKVADAVKILMRCREQGDTTPNLIESVEGSGTYLASYDLAMAWALLGDDLSSRRYFLQAFQENKALEAAIIPIVMLAPNDPTFLHEHFESRLWDAHTYGNYAEAYAIAGFSDADNVISRAVAAFGETESTHRARMALLYSQGYEALLQYTENHPEEINWLLLGIYELEHMRVNTAYSALQQGGFRGQYILALDQSQKTQPTVKWTITPIIREIIAMRAEQFLVSHLKDATDIDNVWIQLKYSPIKQVLVQMNWTGHTAWQCEMNALRALQEKKMEEVPTWLKKARSIQPTVTQTIMACNLAWSRSDHQTARKLLYEGKTMFPQSEMLKYLSSLIHNQTSPQQVMKNMKSNSPCDR